MMTEECPSPRSGKTWSVTLWINEQSEIVRMTIEYLLTIDELTKEMVGECTADGFCVSFWGERRFEDGEDEILSLSGSLVHSDTTCRREEAGMKRLSEGACNLPAIS